MNTTDRARRADPVSLAASAERMLDEAIDIQQTARGWLAATQDLPNVDEATRDGALETAVSIDATVDGLGWSAQALHRAADPDAPPWQREAPAPLVTDDDGELTPTERATVSASPVTRAGLGAEAHVLAEELDELGYSIERLTTASRDWLDDGAMQGTDAAVQEHARRACDNLGETLAMCCYTVERAEISAENLTGPHDDTTQVTDVVDEAENGLNNLRRHDPSSTARDTRGIDDIDPNAWAGHAGHEHSVDREPVLEQEPPF